MQDDDQGNREINQIVIASITCLIAGLIVGLAMPVIFNLSC